jgi:glutaredoxin-related protein
MRFEARTKPQIVEYMEYFDRMLQAYPQVDRTKLHAQIQAFSE